MRDLVTTLLDAAGLLLLAAAAWAGLSALAGWLGLLAAGLVLLAGAALADGWRPRRVKR